MSDSVMSVAADAHEEARELLALMAHHIDQLRDSLADFALLQDRNDTDPLLRDVGFELAGIDLADDEAVIVEARGRLVEDEAQGDARDEDSDAAQVEEG